jgi:putative aminopeptidase FrvX
MKELLSKLTGIYGPSGNEERVREYIRNKIKDYADEMHVDVMGNLIAVKKGTDKRIMLAAHMDQIGLMATHIDEKGFIRFTNVGGIHVLNSIRRKVVFNNGVMGVVSYEGEIDQWKDIKLHKMYIDIGASNQEEAMSMVSIGDVAVYYSPFAQTGSRCYCGAMDNRAGCTLLIQTLKELKQSPHEIYFVFTVQEELGLRGAKTSAFALEPDIGIAVDVTLTGDTPKSRPMDVKLGAGPAIKVKDNSVISHPKVKELMVQRAKEIDIPYQMEILEGGGTDSGAIHLTKGGIPSGVLSIPCRYVHSDNEMIDIKDMENGVKLLLNILKNPIEF